MQSERITYSLIVCGTVWLSIFVVLRCLRVQSSYCFEHPPEVKPAEPEDLSPPLSPVSPKPSPTRLTTRVGRARQRCREDARRGMPPLSPPEPPQPTACSRDGRREEQWVRHSVAPRQFCGHL